MRIEVLCFANLAQHAPEGGFMELPEGMLVGDVLRKLALAPEDVKLIFVNGKHSTLDRSVHDGDRIAFVPAVGGG